MARCLLMLFFLQTLTILRGMENGFTFQLAPRTKECFFEDLKKNMSLDMEYQVIDGGDLDINFEVTDPDGKQLLYVEKTSDDAHELNIHTSGEYRFCFDNSFSTMTTKIVYVDLGVEKDQDYLKDEEHFESAFKVYNNLEGIRMKLDKMSTYQSSVRAKEARQRYFLESNNYRIVLVSSVASVIMIITGFIQVYFVRHLFDVRNRTRI